MHRLIPALDGRGRGVRELTGRRLAAQLRAQGGRRPLRCGYGSAVTAVQSSTQRLAITDGVNAVC